LSCNLLLAKSADLLLTVIIRWTDYQNWTMLAMKYCGGRVWATNGVENGSV